MTRAEIDATIRATLEQARVKAGSAAALANQLQEIGIGPEAGSYSPSAVSNWIRGRVRPPADVVLAASRLYGLPLGPASDDATEPHSRSARVSPENQPTAPPVSYRQSSETNQRSTKDIVCAFASRSEAQAAYPFIRIIEGAGSVSVMGLSLNSLCQGISDVTLRELIENGLVLRCLFLDPDGEFSKQREEAEGLPEDTLNRLTTANLFVPESLQNKLSDEARERVSVRLYNKVLRYNLTIADNFRMLMQPYLSSPRGIDSPGLLIEHQDDQPHGLFPMFVNEFEETWQGARLA